MRSSTGMFGTQRLKISELREARVFLKAPAPNSASENFAER